MVFEAKTDETHAAKVKTNGQNGLQKSKNCLEVVSNCSSNWKKNEQQNKTIKITESSIANGQDHEVGERLA